MIYYSQLHISIQILFLHNCVTSNLKSRMRRCLPTTLDQKLENARLQKMKSLLYDFRPLRFFEKIFRIQKWLKTRQSLKLNLPFHIYL